MDESTKKVRVSNMHWTNERHVHFLNSMEASFVQSMFKNNNRFTPPPPLDRYLPDSSESTEDSGKERRRRNSASESGRRTEKKTGILSCQKSSQDQVVPQFQKKDDRDKDDDEKDRPHLSLGTAN